MYPSSFTHEPSVARSDHIHTQSQARLRAGKMIWRRKLASALAAIFNRLPGFNFYRKIYIENHELDVLLQSKIAIAYDEFIDFSIFTTN